MRFPEGPAPPPGLIDRSQAPSRDELGADRRGYRMRRMLALADCVVVAAAIAVLGLLDAPLGNEDVLGIPLAVHNPALFAPGAILLWLLYAGTGGTYHADKRRIRPSVTDDVGRLTQLSGAWAWSLVLIDSLLTEGTVPVAPIAALWFLMLPGVLVARALVRRVAEGLPWYRQSAFLVGSETDTGRVAAVFERHPEYGIDVARTIELNETSGMARVRGLIDSARDANVARVIFASAHEGLDERTGALRYLAEEGIVVDLVPGDSELFRSDAELHFVEGLPILTLPTTDRPRSVVFIKRGLDIAIAGVSLVALTPLFAYCAVRIKLDSPGPVLFRQRRIGREGQPFEVAKFRTMVADADRRKDQVRELNTRTDGMFKISDDPRITRFGAKLRHTSLDELPQLINVLRGEMSLVGPRPLIEDEARLIADRYQARFRVKPGMTGPWQVHGRSDIPFQKMVKLDYAYVVGWSLGDDLKLLMRTASALARGRGAY